MYCQAYARGVSDGLKLWRVAQPEGAEVCIPENVSERQLIARPGAVIVIVSRLAEDKEPGLRGNKAGDGGGLGRTQMKTRHRARATRRLI
jgi:hypothetical protein